MVLIVLTFALCPSLRAVVWQKQQREVSLLKLVRHFQASADQWLQALFQSGAQLDPVSRARLYGCGTLSDKGGAQTSDECPVVTQQLGATT